MVRRGRAVSMHKWTGNHGHACILCMHTFMTRSTHGGDIGREQALLWPPYSAGSTGLARGVLGLIDLR